MLIISCKIPSSCLNILFHVEYSSGICNAISYIIKYYYSIIFKYENNSKEMLYV